MYSYIGEALKGHEYLVFVFGGIGILIIIFGILGAIKSSKRKETKET